MTSQEIQCAAYTKSGTRCTRNAEPGSLYCWQHQDYNASTSKVAPPTSPIQSAPPARTTLCNCVECNCAASKSCGEVSESACALRRAMNKLWSDHVFWTRLYIISATEDKPDLKVTTDRLLRNQDDIGNAIIPYYGAKAGNELAKLLREHILISADVVKAAKSGNEKEFKNADIRWHDNADDLAAFLNKANPKHWEKAEMRDMLYKHLKLTTEEASLRLHKNWSADVAKFDEVYNQILEMAGGLADGIIAQFPEKF